MSECSTCRFVHISNCSVLLRTYCYFLYIPARDASRQLQALKPEHRSEIIYKLGNLLLERRTDILIANRKDVEKARMEGEIKFCPRDGIHVIIFMSLVYFVYGFSRTTVELTRSIIMTN